MPMSTASTNRRSSSGAGLCERARLACGHDPHGGDCKRRIRRLRVCVRLFHAEVGARDGGQAGMAEAMRDRSEISSDVDRLVVDVCRAKGIGATAVSAPKNGWPPTIVVRLHGFSELESFSAPSRAGKLECALSRPELRAPTQTWWVGSVRPGVLRRGPDGFEVELPRCWLQAAVLSRSAGSISGADSCSLIAAGAGAPCSAHR
jgi:hypothetical protein